MPKEMDEHELPTLGSGSRMLETLGLGRNPYVDRTAEKTLLQTKSFYLHSDLQGFKPSQTTYIFFGRRGSGKTTIRLMMMQKYEDHNRIAFQNEQIRENNQSFETTNEKPVFVVDLCQPGSLQGCLKAFMNTIESDEDNWDARFTEQWTKNDVADCILSCAINTLVKEVSHNTALGKRIVANLKEDRRSSAQFLLLAHLFTQEDSNTLNYLTSVLLPLQMYRMMNPRVLQNYIFVNALGLASFVASCNTLLNGKQQEHTVQSKDELVDTIVKKLESVTPAQHTNEPISSPPKQAEGWFSTKWISDKVYGSKPAPSAKPVQVTPTPAPVPARSTPAVKKQPAEGIAKHVIVGGLFGALALGLFGVGLAKMRKYKGRTEARLEAVYKSVRVVNPDPSRIKLLRSLLSSLVSPNDSADTVIRLYLGESAQSKLELLNSLCVGCGFTEGVAVFGDCFDEVGLLDPLKYSASLKAFAREVCRNEILNRGRLHFFFPDSRAAMDLSTDKVVREARFDRHFVRDLSWSRFQLLDLAKRRFMAAQWDCDDGLSDRASSKKAAESFSSLFQHVSKEDFSASISKLRTPRELMVFMTELLARLEACSEENTMVTAADMEVAVTRAQQQTI